MITTADMLDGFTFQGGDVQVLIWHNLNGYANYSGYLTGRITNNVFDMRHDWIPAGETTKVSGPLIGIMLAHKYYVSGTAQGYFNQPFLIANNTFILDQQQPFANYSSRDKAVGIIDVTDPYAPGGSGDCDLTLRGIGNPCIVNNLFRTPAAEFNSGGDARLAMMGIDSTDVLCAPNDVNFAMHAKNYNAHGATRANQPNNGLFFSLPVISSTVGGSPPRWYCATNLCWPPVCGAALYPPQPVIRIWEGNPTAVQEYDPGFVGEYLTTVVVTPSPPPVVDGSVVDWRLLPGSPMSNQGLSYASGFQLFQTSLSVIYSDGPCSELRSFDWDGENYGNPRTIDGIPDLGFDEVDILIAGGSWGNDTNSHYRPSPVLQGNAPHGRIERQFIFPVTVNGSAITINGVGVVPTLPLVAWSMPPETLPTPVINPNEPTLPNEKKTRYISFLNSGTTPTAANGWPFTPSPTSLVSYAVGPGSQPTLRFYRAVLSDDDAAVIGGGSAQPNLYFSMEAKMRFGQNSTWWSNLQSEFR